MADPGFLSWLPLPAIQHWYVPAARLRVCVAGAKLFQNRPVPAGSAPYHSTLGRAVPSIAYHEAPRPPPNDQYGSPVAASICQPAAGEPAIPVR